MRWLPAAELCSFSQRVHRDRAQQGRIGRLDQRERRFTEVAHVCRDFVGRRLGHLMFEHG